MNEPPITVTSPLLPDLDEFHALLGDIWQSKWITNNGSFHKRLEQELAAYLKVPFVSLFTNGSLPLIAAMQVLGINKGEVITTPYSFVATTHALWWNGCTPVFVDVDPVTGNLDPACIEAAITPQTVAIMPVHVYGQPCDTERIQALADKHGLKVIYDAAHAFGVEVNGQSVLNAGDLSTLSFHATKVYNTIEGGAMVMQDEQMKQRVDSLRNFGFESELDIIGAGINSKMDEMRSAYGLLNLRQVDAAIEARRRVARCYREALQGVPGLRMMQELPGVSYNYSYFPIFIEPAVYGRSRDELFICLKEQGIISRRYFYPLISTFRTYRELETADPARLPHAQHLAESVICLPLHHELSEVDVERIIALLAEGY